MDGYISNFDNLKLELTNYKRNGVTFCINGIPANIEQILNAHMIKGISYYMRDYLFSTHGHLLFLSFNSPLEISHI
ncbi:MAG: hypothetical protein LBM02_02800 [Lachnospiraceae bacterium]|nr:hypothetical protein [Lachnospiraceae bacterium]